MGIVRQWQQRNTQKLHCKTKEEANSGLLERRSTSIVHDVLQSPNAEQTPNAHENIHTIVKPADDSSRWACRTESSLC
jgi:hypothetical protein